MNFLARLCGFDALSRRIDDLTLLLTEVNQRVVELERRVLPAPYGCRDWEAWQERRPSARPTLYVRGSCTFPSDGFEVTLERGEPQGANPRDLLLDLTIKEPITPVPQIVTDEEAHYEEETDTVFETVTIRPDGPTVRVRATA
jgi:hypothetical protein